MFEEECTLCDSENGEYNDGTNKCLDCGNKFCNDHVDKCADCGKQFCDRHIYSIDDTGDLETYKCSECLDD